MIQVFKKDTAPDKASDGFTLVELMLSLAFIALLMVAIATTVIHISNSYTKGLTLREVNQVGRLVTQELQRLIAESDDSDNVSFRERKFRDGENNITGGRICFDRSTIFWNSSYGLKSGASTKNVLGNSSSESDQSKKIKLYIIKNGGAIDYCSPYGMRKHIDDTGQGQDLISKGRSVGGINLVVHSIDMGRIIVSDRVDQDSLHRVSFIVGTEDNEIINYDKNACKAPGERDVDDKDLYCAINKFEFIVKPGVKKEQA